MLKSAVPVEEMALCFYKFHAYYRLKYIKAFLQIF